MTGLVRLFNLGSRLLGKRAEPLVTLTPSFAGTGEYSAGQVSDW